MTPHRTFGKLVRALGEVDAKAWGEGWLTDREVAETIACYLDIHIPEESALDSVERISFDHNLFVKIFSTP